MEKLVEKVMKLSEQGDSLKEIARTVGISEQKVRRLLITNDGWSSPRADEIRELAASGLTASEICDMLQLSRSTVFAYLPYTKGPHNSDNPTKNALAIRRFRERKKAQS